MKNFMPLVVFSLFSLLSLWGCGLQTTQPSTPSTGSLHLFIRIKAPALAKASNVAATSWSNIIIQVTGSDMAAINDTVSVSVTHSVKTCTLSAIPSGSNRTVTVWSVNAATGDTIHTPASNSVTIGAGSTSLSVTLTPAKGSMYLSLFDLASDIDSVHAAFTASATTWQAGAKDVAGRVNINLDYIPHNTSGTLTIKAYNAAGVELPGYTYTRALTFLASADTTITPSWQTLFGSLQLDVAPAMPGVFFITGTMNSARMAVDSIEAGVCYISEIMASSNEEEFIELYNPTSSTVTYDTLYLGLSGRATWYLLEGVSIPADSFYVITADSASYTNTRISTLATSLSGAGGSLWLRAKDSTLIDVVTFPGETEDVNLGWPNISSSAATSMVLDSLPQAGVRYNNYGKNWSAAVTTYTGSDAGSKKGTPGTRGI